MEGAEVFLFQPKRGRHFFKIYIKVVLLLSGATIKFEWSHIVGKMYNEVEIRTGLRKRFETSYEYLQVLLLYTNKASRLDIFMHKLLFQF